MGHPSVRCVIVHHRELPAGLVGEDPCHVDGGESGYRATGCSSPMLTCCSSQILCGGRWLMPRPSGGSCGAVSADDHEDVPGEYMMIAFFQTMFVFGHRPWKVADPKHGRSHGSGRFQPGAARVYDAVGTYEALRMEVLDDMKLGKVVKNAGFAQRNVFGGDLISIRWAHGAMRRGRQSDQEFLCRAVVSMVANGAFGVRAGVSEFRAVSRDLAGAGMGAMPTRLRWLRCS